MSEPVPLFVRVRVPPDCVSRAIVTSLTPVIVRLPSSVVVPASVSAAVSVESPSVTLPARRTLPATDRGATPSLESVPEVRVSRVDGPTAPSLPIRRRPVASVTPATSLDPVSVSTLAPPFVSVRPEPLIGPIVTPLAMPTVELASSVVGPVKASVPDSVVLPSVTLPLWIVMALAIVRATVPVPETVVPAASESVPDVPRAASSPTRSVPVFRSVLP